MWESTLETFEATGSRLEGVRASHYFDIATQHHHHNNDNDLLRLYITTNSPQAVGIKLNVMRLSGFVR